MTKQIIVINPDDSEREIYAEELGKDGLPPSKTMQAIVGGPVEMVRVLRADLPGFVYTYMAVNETGLLDRLPGNPKATEIYLANVRRQYPDSPEPWEAAQDAWRKSLPEPLASAPVFDITPEPYRSKQPVVVGTVIWFDGYTCEELEEMGL